jgi:ABC-type sugar transport system permease subunit
MVSIMGVQVWRMAGFCTVLYLAALAAISDSLYEAAEIDGAGRWQALRHITWPQARPMTAFLLVAGAIGALKIFDLIWALTASAETDGTNVLNLYVYREFQQGRLGYGAAIGVVIFALTLVATGAQLFLLRRRGVQ